jgi:NADH-quinone oxidoreductase subunit B
MGLEEKLLSGILPTTAEKLVGYTRKNSVWPATFGLACCAVELFQASGPRHDLARFGMERASATPRQADLMILAGRVSQKMTPVLRQIYDQMAEPKCVISMGSAPPAAGCSTTTPSSRGSTTSCRSISTRPAARPGPEMLLDAILKLHDKIQNMKLDAHREAEIDELEQASLRRRLLAAQDEGHEPARAQARQESRA